jgi:RNA polymerase sigma-70 factor (ECF subfamily)
MPDDLDESAIRDDLLRLLFVCCHDGIPRESQLVIALKILCGFSVREIAHRLFASEAKIYKRLERARERLRESSFDKMRPEIFCSLRSRTDRSGIDVKSG